MSSIDANVAASLARHEQRRRQGIPTVSLLVGPPGIGASTWREWIASQGRAVAACHAPDEHAALRAWIAAATEGHDLRALAAAAVARHMGDEPEDLLRRIERTAAHERALLLDQATDGLDPPLSRVCRRVLDGAPAAPEPGASWGVEGLLGPEGSHAGSTLDGIARLLPAHAGPGLLFAPRETLPPGDWLRHVVALASAFVEERPGLSVAVASHVSLADLPESRAKALLREGEVWLPCLGARDVAAILSAHGATAERAPASSVARLVADGADAALATLYALAADGAEDGARSLAERFLHARLESLPWAAGLFTLNGHPGFRFGGHDAEVDLLAQEPLIAIEIDGYYHFQDRDAYRRDRRKDVALQTRGYLVLRFLEEDIVARLEHILDTIASAVRHRAADPEVRREEE
jgi:hypothetical protein